MIEPKHTPTPWTIESTPSRIEVRTDPMHVYAFSHADRGNAEFIVRAVNAHEQLTAALETLVREWDLGREPLASDWSKARAALRAARGEK